MGHDFVAAVLGFPVAVALAWFYEVGDHGLQRDTAAEDAVRPSVHGKRRYGPRDHRRAAHRRRGAARATVRHRQPPPPASPAIAVLPFENLSGNPQQDYFSDGLAVEVLDRLGRVPGLRVIASSSLFSFKGKNQDARTVAEQLGVTTVLQGSVRRDGRKLKVNAKLIDGTTGFQLWSGSFDREVTDLFAHSASVRCLRSCASTRLRVASTKRRRWSRASRSGCARNLAPARRMPRRTSCWPR